MNVQGRIIKFEPDFELHKPKITLELTRQDNLGDFSKLKDELVLDIEIKKHREKRSNRANSYCWELLTKISEIIGNSKEDVYRDFISHKGIYRQFEIDNSAVDTFKHLWLQRGLGWLCDTLESDENKTTIFAYYGTSSYNTKQMADFIDYVVQEAKQLGIETETPEEIAKMKAMWIPSI